MSESTYDIVVASISDDENCAVQNHWGLLCILGEAVDSGTRARMAAAGKDLHHRRRRAGFYVAAEGSCACSHSMKQLLLLAHARVPCFAAPALGA